MPAIGEKMADHTRSEQDQKGRSPSDTIPAGDLPPQPRWPLIAASAAWGLWIVFLLAMTWLRVRTTPV